MIALKTEDQIAAIGRAGAILSALFEAIKPEIRPGVSTADLDLFGENFIMSYPGAVPSFKGLYGFPASLCISINHEVVHGIPSAKRILQEGDIVSIDAGVQLDGWFADAARTYAVGDVDAVSEVLLRVTQEALDAGIAHARAGNRLGDIGAAVQNVAETAGFSVVRDLVGHGIGRNPHEEPQVPNFGKAGKGLILQPGLVLAIEPMVNAGTPAVRTLADKWTVVTLDKKRSAHFEHTVAITADGPKVLT
ncbi:MAG TPA: type I methionyl aminopeptidase [Burkholderiales bacterium]|nr:type I methionyl aminopeptidase [Burkholderiales bacterium]